MITCCSSATPSASSSGSPRRSAAGPGRRRRCGRSAWATSTVRLPSRRSSPAGLPVSCRVAEHAEQVVAELEGPTERRPVRGQRVVQLRRAAAEGRTQLARPLDRVAGRLVLHHPARLRPAPRRDRSQASVVRAGGPGRRTSRYCPQVTSVRIASRDRGRGGQGGGRQAGALAASPPTTSPAGRPAGSPRPARSVAGSPSQPAVACRLSNCRCAAGRPRRRSEASITSSCTSALTCSSSRLAAAVEQPRPDSARPADPAAAR